MKVIFPFALIALVSAACVAYFQKDAAISLNELNKKNSAQKNRLTDLPKKASQDAETLISEFDISGSKEKTAENLTPKSVEFLKQKGGITDGLSSDYEQWVKLANSGDLDAALVLGKTLQFCALQARSKEDYKKEITNSVSHPLEAITKGYSICKGLSTAQIKESVRFFKMAADTGDLESMMEYAMAAPYHIDGILDRNEELNMIALNKFTSSQVGYAEKALQNGSTDAAAFLGLHYLNNSNAVLKRGEIGNEKSLFNWLVHREMVPQPDPLKARIIEKLSLEIPVYRFKELETMAKKYVNIELKGQTFTTLNRPN